MRVAMSGTRNIVAHKRMAARDHMESRTTRAHRREVDDSKPPELPEVGGLAMDIGTLGIAAPVDVSLPAPDGGWGAILATL